MKLNQESDSDDLPTGALEKLNAIGNALAVSRAEAIDGRKNLGIEKDWKEDEEFYEGIDDANRHEFVGGASQTWAEKPAGTASIADGSKSTGSTIFLNITRPYVEAATARGGDMLLPVDGEKAWEFDITPVPDELAIAKGEMQEDMKADILTEMGGDFNKAQTEVDRITAETVDKLDNLRAAADKASKRIEDWQVASQHHAQLQRGEDKER